jgi:enamine deaminase RidA (YjgF/YER057c/UK114 family)
MARIAVVRNVTANLVKVTVYTTDMRFFDAIAEVRRRYFTGNLPASTIVEVSKLAQPDLLIEIEGVAVL